MAEFKFSCPHCQQHIQADEGYAGMQIQCPSCHGTMIVPGAPPVPAPTAAPPPPPPPRVPARLADSAPAPVASSGATCPSCKTPLPQGAVLCTKCGYNLVTRQRARPGQAAAANRAVAGAAAWYATPWPYLGVVVLLLALFYYLGRDNPPMMLGFLAVAGIYILSVHIITVVHAFKNEGVGTGFLTLCIPLYALYYVFKVSESDTLKVLYGFSVLLNIGLRIIGKLDT